LQEIDDIKPEEMLVGIPMKRIPEIVRALEKMGAGPIPIETNEGALPLLGIFRMAEPEDSPVNFNY